MRYVSSLIPKGSKVLPDYFKGSVYRSNKSNPFVRFLRWFFGIFFLLGAFVQLGHPLLAFFYGLLGFLFLPPGHNWIERTLRFRFRTKAKALFCILVGIAASPLIFFYGDMDRKERQAEQVKLAQEEREKEAVAKKEQLRKDSLNYFISESSRQRGQHKLKDAAKLLTCAVIFSSTFEEKQQIQQENDKISQFEVEDMVSSGQYELAIPKLTELITDNSNDADLLYTRALCYSHMGNIEEAVHDCNSAADLGNREATKLNDKINPVVKHIVGHITLCCDGSTSYATGRGACSHHGGVCSWNSPVYEESRKYQ